MGKKRRVYKSKGSKAIGFGPQQGDPERGKKVRHYLKQKGAALATLKKLYHDAPDKTIPFNQLMGMGIATIENKPMKLHELIHRSERGEEFTWEDRWLFFCGSYHAYETIIRDLQGE